MPNGICAGSQKSLPKSSKERDMATVRVAEPLTGAQLDQLCINTIRTLLIDALQGANSGHPGTPMALAPLVYALWNRVMHEDVAVRFPAYEWNVLRIGDANDIDRIEH